MTHPAAEAINRIAFVTPEGQLATIAPDGEDQRVLTGPGRSFQFPAWSPDGSAIAAIGSDRNGAGVFVCADAPWLPNRLRRLYASPNLPPIYLCWSPDSQMVSFVAAHAQGLALYLTPHAEMALRLVTTGQPCFWNWAPDSDQLLVHNRCFSAEARLIWINRAGDTRPLTIAAPGLFQAPAIAPSGRRLAFAEMAPSNKTSQLVIAADASRNATPHPGVVALGWNPTADQLAFTCPPRMDRNWYGPLRLLDPDRDATRVLTDETVLAFFWGPDGRSIAYLTLVERSPVIAIVPGQVATQAVAGASVARSPQPDLVALRLSLVEVASGRRRSLTTFTPPAVFVNQFLPFFDQYAHSHRIWSPDGQALVVPALTGERTQVVIVPINGSPPRALIEGSMPSWSHC